MKQHVATVGRQEIDVSVYSGGERVELRIKGSKMLGRETKDRRLAIDVSALPDLIAALHDAGKLAARKPEIAPPKISDTTGPLPVIEIYTDGSCFPNPGGPGGWGALVIDDDRERELFGGASTSTNNRMELTAALEGLRALPSPSRVRLYTDAQYLSNGMVKWIAGWKAKGWKDGGGKLRKNHDLWRQLDEESQRHVVEWIWVRGHSGVAGNEKADELAQRGMHEQTEVSADLKMLERCHAY